MKHITLHITESRTTGNHFTQASVRGIEVITGCTTGYNSHELPPKLLQDIICHALSLAHGLEVEGNNGFTYTFPFKLA